MRYRNLLSPIRVRDQVIRNRLIYPNASPHFLQGPENYPSEEYRAFTANLAKNGAGIVITAEWDNPAQRSFPADVDISHMQSFDLSNPAVHNYLSQMADEVHFYGSKLLISLQLRMPEGYSLYEGSSFGPPGAPGITPPPPPKLLPEEMEPEVIERNLAVMRFYKRLGFDGIDLRFDRDLLPNRRGQTVEERTRFVRRYLEAVRAECGDSFLIHATIAWEQPDGYRGLKPGEEGYTANDAAEFIRLTEGIVDIMELRENSICSSHPTGYTMTEGVHPVLDFCRRIRAEGSSMLLEPIGGFQNPDEMEAILGEEACDFFGAARAFMADYEYGRKLYEGRGEDITPCLLCNRCHGELLPEHGPWLSVCSVNPLMGKCAKLNRMLDGLGSTRKKIAVIGGGPAGMRAALFAAEVGHEVTLYEKTDRLGGQLFHSDYFPFKWPIRNYKDWLIDQLEKSEVHVLLNKEPSPEEISAGGYDAVFAATGAVPAVPKSIEGADGSGVLTCLDAIPQEARLGKEIIIVGGSEVGMETAMFLCGKGHNVTVITRRAEPGHNCSKLHYVTMAWIRRMPDGSAREAAAWERYENLRWITEAQTLRTDGHSVLYRAADGQEHALTADNVLISGGMKKQLDSAMKYAGLTDRFAVIGDCAGAGNIQKCTAQAYASVMNL